MSVRFGQTEGGQFIAFPVPSREAECQTMPVRACSPGPSGSGAHWASAVLGVRDLSGLHVLITRHVQGAGGLPRALCSRAGDVRPAYHCGTESSE